MEGARDCEHEGKRGEQGEHVGAREGEHESARENAREGTTETILIVRTPCRQFDWVGQQWLDPTLSAGQ